MNMVNTLLMVCTTITPNNVVKSPSIFIVDKLKFHNHSSTVTKKANSMHGLQHLRNFKKHLFSLCWNMVLSSGVHQSRESTEKITKLIHGLHDTPYHDCFYSSFAIIATPKCHSQVTRIFLLL